MWSFWGPPGVGEFDGVTFMARTLSRDWENYPKDEFLEKMPGTWHGATVEDSGDYVIVPNPGLYLYFEFHFFFPEKRGTRMEFLIVRGRDELRDLWIVGKSGDLACRLKSANETSISRDAQKAAKILAKQFGVKQVSG
ncbi:MAG: hypothetical protein HYR56_28920 [Acidobacteria bacterium]|nr:hypothetical protein [Acidobacteriota bacterium]MBI3423991.1 hypothetical protein [Acidobacteriota bacterium]